MFKPRKLKAQDLQHPKDKRSTFNGDKRRPADEQGFASRRESKGLSVVEGTRQPSNLVKPITTNDKTTELSYTPGRGPTRLQRALDDREAREATSKPLTPRQKRQVKGGR